MSITLPRVSGTLSEGQGLRAHVRRLAEVATHPLVPADFLDLFAPLRPGADLRGRIVSVTTETKDAATLVIKPGADWAGHVPGQYVRIGVDVDGVAAMAVAVGTAAGGDGGADRRAAPPLPARWPWPGDYINALTRTRAIAGKPYQLRGKETAFRLTKKVGQHPLLRLGEERIGQASVLRLA